MSPTDRCGRWCSTPAGPTATPGRSGSRRRVAPRSRWPVCSAAAPPTVVVCSTGLIGEPLDRRHARSPASTGGRARPTPRRRRGRRRCDHDDRQPCQDRGRRPRRLPVGGMAKGAGMLAPGLATMLVVLTTDADVSADGTRRRAARRLAGSRSTGWTPTVAMSTNDTVVLMACGASGEAVSTADLTDAVQEACHDLADAADRRRRGQRSTTSRSRVTGAADEDDAVAVGAPVARSNLVKTRDLRPRPELGTGAGRGRDDVRRLRPGRRRRDDQRCRVCCRGAAGDSRGTTSTSAARWVDVDDRPPRRRGRGDGLDQRPHPSRTSTRTRRTRRDPQSRLRHADPGAKRPCWSRCCRGSSACHGSSSS